MLRPRLGGFVFRRGNSGRQGPTNGPSGADARDRNNPGADRIGRRRLGGVRRSFDLIAAELELIDCGSLDVLLYCTDELAVSVPATGSWPDRLT